MKRLAALLLLVFASAPVVANFGLLRGHPWFGRSTSSYYAAPSQSHYYVPQSFYAPQPMYAPQAIYASPVEIIGTAPACQPAVNQFPVIAQPQPLAVQPPPAIVQPPLGVVRPPPAVVPERATVPPVRRPVDSAVPESAPPTERGPVIPPGRSPPPSAGIQSTSFKPGEIYFSTYSSGDNLKGMGVTFWNLSPGSLTLRAGGQTLAMAAGSSATLELGREFTWQVGDRAEEVGRLTADEISLTVVIRR